MTKYYCNCWACISNKEKKNILQDKTDRQIDQWANELSKRQIPLDKEFQKILDDHRWELYKDLE